MPLNTLLEKEVNNELAYPAADITLFTTIKTVCEGLKKLAQETE